MVTTWGATTSQILALREHLYRGDGHVCGHRVDSFYYLFDDALNMMLVNASRVRNVPGRKTDLIRQQLGNHILGHRVQIALRC